MNVYVVTQHTLFGATDIVGVYTKEIEALREANKSTMRKVGTFPLLGDLTKLSVAPILEAGGDEGDQSRRELEDQ